MNDQHSQENLTAGLEEFVISPPGGDERHFTLAAAIIMVLGLFLALKLRLLTSLLAGLLVYELVQVLVDLLKLGNLRGYRAKVTAIAVIATFTVALLTLAFFGIFAFLQSGAESLPNLLKEMAAVLESTRTLLPAGLSGQLPADVEDLKLRAVELAAPACHRSAVDGARSLAFGRPYPHRHDHRRHDFLARGDLR